MAKKKVKRKINSRKTRRGVSPLRSRNVTARRLSGKNLPTGFKIIAVIFYIAAVLHIIAAIFMFIGGLVGQRVIESFGIDNLLRMFPNLTPEDVQNAISLTPYLIASAILMFGLAILEIYIGRDIFNAKNWARYTALVFVALGLIGVLSTLSAGFVLGSLIMFILYMIVGWYLWLSRNALRTFGN